jgi:amino-acid N-acetyltransferase
MATALVKHVEAYVVDQGIDRLYLLTNTAEAFFARLGYRTLPRSAAPQAIRDTSEFSSLCPDDAAFMGKELPRDPASR